MTHKHIGNNIENKLDGMQKDIRIKRAIYIQRNCELNQEFHFTHPETKFHVNNVYNSSFTGSPLWNLFSGSAESLEKTYNVSVRTMFNLPFNTHRYLIEPLYQCQHLKFILIKRFLQFKEQVGRCPKKTVKNLFKICQYDASSVTGSNFRKIMLLCDKNQISSLQITDIDLLTYKKCPENELWRISLISELIEARRNVSELLSGFTMEELQDMLSLTS